MSEKDKTSNNNIEEALIINRNGIYDNNINTNYDSEDVNTITEWINNLTDSEKRVNALLELSKKRDSFSELAVYLWYSPGVISAL